MVRASKMEPVSSASDLPALPLGRDSVMWRVSTEPAFLLPSGPRALLLQVAHPAVSAGVADHSDYESRPWVRLVGTLDVMNKLAFGTPEGSARQARRLRERHAEITGTQPDGQAYRALDAGNMLWVWATLVDTLVVSYERYVRPWAPPSGTSCTASGRPSAGLAASPSPACPRRGRTSPPTSTRSSPTTSGPPRRPSPSPTRSSTRPCPARSVPPSAAAWPR